MLGARRTTVTLIAQNFQNDGIIKYRRGHIKLDEPSSYRMLPVSVIRRSRQITKR
jgi:hypothetical protein